MAMAGNDMAGDAPVASDDNAAIVLRSYDALNRQDLDTAYVAGPGDTHLARPRDIHVEWNVGERTAAVIIRSMRDGVPTNLHGRYDLVTGRYHESIGPRQIPAEMLPKK